MKETQLHVAISQIAPVWLNKEQTTLKIITQIDESGAKGCPNDNTKSITLTN